MAPRKIFPIPDLNERMQPARHVQLQPVQQNTSQDGDDSTNFRMATRSIHFEDNDQDDAAWHFAYHLGKGGYGTVGLWEKRSDTNEEMAVKETAVPNRDIYSVVPGGPEVPEEAIVQRALQKNGCTQIVQLRGLRILNRPDEARPLLRYYLEYCAYYDLWNLMIAYYRNQEAAPPDVLVSIPEPFLWHLLYNFAQAMLAMQSGPFDHPLAGIHDDNPFILHLDVKLQNIMLGDPEDEDILKLYPACKVGDWGLATLTSKTDRCNSGQIYRHGTRHWHPPEQYMGNGFGADWDRLPPWRFPHSQFHRYTPAHSMFAFASVVFRLMVLDLKHKALDTLLEYASMRRAASQLWAQDFAWIDDTDMDFNTLKRPTRYSGLLKDTVARCLNLNPPNRLSAAELSRISYRECVRLADHQRQHGYLESDMLNFDRDDNSTT